MIPVWVALAALAAGTALKANADTQARKAQQAKLTEELLRQRGHQKDAALEFDKALSASAPEKVQEDMAAGSQKRMHTYGETNARAPVLAEQLRGPAPDTGNQVVQGERRRAMSGAQGRADQQALARALLAGFGDANFAGNLARAHGNQRQGLIGNFAQGSRAVLPFEQQAAAHSKDDQALLGSMLSLFGSIMLGGAGAGAGGAGAASTTTGAAASGGALGSGMYGTGTAGMASLFGTQAASSPYAVPRFGISSGF